MTNAARRGVNADGATAAVHGSLFGAYRVLTDPATRGLRVAVLDGGLNAWFRAGLPGQGEREWTFNAKVRRRASE